PTASTSAGRTPRWKLISDAGSNPSIPPTSTNAPKSLSAVTTPGSTAPTTTLPRVSAARPRASSSSRARRDSTTFVPRRSSPRLQRVTDLRGQLAAFVAQLQRLQRPFAAIHQLEHRHLVADGDDLAAHAITDREPGPARAAAGLLGGREHRREVLVGRVGRLA